MGQEIAQAAFDEEDFTRFSERLRQETATLRQMFADGAFSGAPHMCGMELEAWLTDADYLPSPSNGPFLEALQHPMVGPELSQFNFELNNTPLYLRSGTVALAAMQEELTALWTQCSDTAEAMGLHAVAIGVIPTLRDQMLTTQIMSVSNRFHAMNRQLFSMRAGMPLSFHIDEGETLHVEQADIMLEAAATSLQVHFQIGQEDAVRSYNASLIASAACVAAAANAPYLYGRSLWEETRIAIFERAVPSGHLRDAQGNVIARVGFGTDYAHQSLFEPFAENLAAYPPILPVRMDEDAPESLPHLRLHNGTIWRWNRPLIGVDPRSGNPSLRIEHRSMSAGPTIVDSMANIAFYLGLTQGLAMLDPPPEARLPFAAARENFYGAAKYGLAANVTWLDGQTHSLRQLCLEELLPLAAQGLRHLGVSEADVAYYLDGVLAPRIAGNRTGAAWQKAYIATHGADFTAMTAAYAANQQQGHPVHEWTV